jgi:RNA polymerase sigma-70 factor, ECF subfamily
MSGEQAVTTARPITAPPDPAAWLDRHGDYLFRYARLRLRDDALAEDAVQETLLAALQSRDKFAGRGSERTWLTGILKHKIVDHFRRAAREAQPDEEGEGLEPEHLFMQTGEWAGHWVAVLVPEKAHLGPNEWNATPEQAAEQAEFWEVFGRCLEPLPPRVASAFMLRELEGLSSEEICAALGVKANNLWVMLHRARAHLRNCVEVNWFMRGRAKGR